MASSILSDAISGKHLIDENEGGISTMGRSWLKVYIIYVYSIIDKLLYIQSEGSTGNYRRSLEVTLPTSGGDETIEYGEMKKRTRSSNTR